MPDESETPKGNSSTAKLYFTWNPFFQVARTSGFMVAKSWSWHEASPSEDDEEEYPPRSWVAVESSPLLPVAVLLNNIGSRTTTSFHGTKMFNLSKGH